MKKNNLYVVYGGKTEESDDYVVWFTEKVGEYKTFKNKEKAEAYKEQLLDQYMKTKSYSPHYEILDDYKVEDAAIDTYQTDIRDKHDYTVFRVEMLVIDLSKVIM